MFNFIAAIAKAAANWVAETVFTLSGGTAATHATAATGKVMSAQALANIAYAATFATVTVGSYAALAAATAPGLPKGAAGKQQILDPVSPRLRVINRARMPGVIMLRESRKNRYLVTHVAMAPIVGVDRRWLHSDTVTLDGNSKVIAPAGSPAARYRAHGVWWLDRFGAVGQDGFNDGTVYNGETFDDLGTDVWPEDARLQGMKSSCLICTPVERADFQSVYPYGKPVMNEAPIGAVYDWRKDSTEGGDGDHRLDDWSTWEESWNPVLWYATLEAGAPERPDFESRFRRRVLSQLAAWTQAADDCDEEVPTAVEEVTEPRYRTAGGWYFDTNDPADARARLLAAFDGFTMEMPGGGLHIQAGVYREPTFTLPLRHILEDDWTVGRDLEQARNVYVISFFRHEDYEVAPGAPLRDEADIALRGEQSIVFSADWVPSHRQAKALAKIDKGRRGAMERSPIKASLYAEVFLYGPPPVEGDAPNRRWINIEREGPAGTVQTVICELVSSPKTSLAETSVSFDVIAATPEAYDFDPATEEGTPAPTPEPAEVGALTKETRFNLVSRSRYDDLVASP